MKIEISSIKFIHGRIVFALFVEQLCTTTGAVLVQGEFSRQIESHVLQDSFVFIL